jgi:hypothetical protein
MAHEFVLAQPDWLVQREITTSTRLSPTLLSKENQRGFETDDKHSDGHSLSIHILSSLRY